MLSTLFLIVLLSWLGLGILAFLTPLAYGKKILYGLRALNILCAGLTLASGLIGLIASHPLLLPLPWLALPMHPTLRLDALANFFILLLGTSAIGITFFGLDYFKHFNLSQQKQIQGWQGIFLFAMLLVFTANNPITFLFAWELMALSSYFLVVCVNPNKAIRTAGLLYLALAHVGFFAIASSFFLLASHTGSIYSDFNQWSSFHDLTPIANLVFILALLGFGAKAGLFPLHVWLPEAHPAAPSPISALMSGVMLKTAIYGLLRFLYDFLLPYQQLWWGYALVIVGLLTMLIGVIHAALQIDMKRLLAYSSMENLGFIVVALGLSVIFYQYQNWSLANLALIVVLLHSFNHSVFKSLLFLGTGSILHATGERNLGKLGGLIHKMPWVALCTLIGTLAMAGLPLLNGFIGEWLYLTLFFQHSFSAHFNLAILSPLIVAWSILVFGLAGYVIVKFFGIAFLGQPREPALMHTHRSTLFECIGLGWLAGGCLIFGLFPQPLIQMLQTLNRAMVPQLLPAIPTHTWFMLNTSSSSAPNTTNFNLIILGISSMIVLLIIAGLVRYLSPHILRRSAAWDCGYRGLTPRMQDTAEGFAQPFKQIFSQFVDIKLTLPHAEDTHPHYRAQLREKIWRLLYRPLAKIIIWISGLTHWIQQGKISTYLLYIAITLLVLLTLVVWS